jgi:hypothetical protein
VKIKCGHNQRYVARLGQQSATRMVQCRPINGVVAGKSGGVSVRYEKSLTVEGRRWHSLTSKPILNSAGADIGGGALPWLRSMLAPCVAA